MSKPNHIPDAKKMVQTKESGGLATTICSPPVYAVPANEHGFFVVSAKVPEAELRKVMEMLVKSDRIFNAEDL